jgi:hypothetical protein
VTGLYLLVIVISLIVLSNVHAFIKKLSDKAKLYDKLKPELDNLNNYKVELSQKSSCLDKEKIKLIERTREIESYKQDVVKWCETFKQDVETLGREKTNGFPWLASAYADYNYLKQLKAADFFEYKTHPAEKSADKVREIAKERRTIEKKLRIAQGIINYYHSMFPFLEDFQEIQDDEILRSVLSREVEKTIKSIEEIDVDPVRIYLAGLSKEEYQKLTPIERNQKALDRYWNKHKSRWELGRDYERYIGYIYEVRDYSVYYQGILEGYDDLGRDLICKSSESTIVIQCKRWAQHKVIHEKHINQLYGTTVKYMIDHPNEKVSAAIYTTTTLSDRARVFAKYLHVGVHEQYPFKMYPTIKCNISKRDNSKIYHLPFDQQYDRTIIKKNSGELYVRTVEQAEQNGFRRAWKWKGNEEVNTI